MSISAIFIGYAGLIFLMLAWTPAISAPLGELRFESQLEALSGPGWRAEAVSLRMTYEKGRISTLAVTAQRFTLTAPPVSMEKVSLHCGAVKLGGEEISCTEGVVRIAKLQDRAAEGRFRFTYRPADKKVTLALSDLSVGEGRIHFTAQRDGQAWQARLEAIRLEANLLESWLIAVPGMLLAEGKNRGLVNVKAVVSGSGGTAHEGQLHIQSPRLNAASQSGNYAAESLAFHFDGRWQVSGRFSGELRVLTGQIYVEPVFLQIDASEKPLVIRFAGRLNKQSLALDSVHFNHPGVVRAQASAQVLFGDETQLQKVELTLDKAIFPAVYTTYLQPFSGHGGSSGQLETRGAIQGRVSMVGGELQELALKLTGLYLEDAANRFGFKGLRGTLIWSPEPKPQHSQLRWDRGHVYKLTIGAGRLPFESRKGTLRLLQESRIPILNGALIIAQMEAEGLQSTPLRWRFDGFLKPLSMVGLSQALGWPPLAGKLSGMMPDVHYGNGRLEVGGSLLLRIFDGDITVTNLRINDLFGTAPEAFADLALRHLDLETLTQAFDFGRIQGKVGGQVKGLHLLDWQPIGFDAFFATPQGDRSRRRISQRAVQNLSALSGGNPTAMLSRGFLSLFEAFRYKRLGLRCRLRNGVCEMGGVGSAGTGYYLVEGEGLPRIDVIGYNQRVDWDELVTRLRAAIQSGRPIVE